METPFDRSFDELLNGLLTDYRNQVDQAGDPIDTSKGSLAFIKSACTASALWGLYAAQGYIGDQIFPDTASRVNLERHAYVRGVSPKAGESDSELLARLLDYIRRPPAGGNRYDYVKWAMAVPGVASAFCFPEANGPGTVDVVIAADPASGSIVPDADLIEAVRSAIDLVRPVTGWGFRVLATQVLLVDITIQALGDAADRAQTAADVTAYMNTLVSGQPLYLVQLANIAIINGADDAIVLAPAVNVLPVDYQTIRPGVISVL